MTQHEWVKPSRRPAPRRVRLYQNGHGAYLAQRLIRSNAHPAAHWGQGLGLSGIIRPPRVQRTQAQVHAFMAYERAQSIGFDFYH